MFFGSFFIFGRGMISAVAVILASGIEEASTQPAAGAICMVRREIYVPSPQPGLSPVVGVQYLGKSLRRREIRGLQGKSDLAEKMEVRFSDDNGRTWTPLAPLETGSDALRQGQNSREDLSFAVNFDPASRL